MNVVRMMAMRVEAMDTEICIEGIDISTQQISSRATITAKIDILVPRVLASKFQNSGAACFYFRCCSVEDIKSNTIASQNVYSIREQPWEVASRSGRIE
jgi:hypothetical protein